VTPKNRAPGKLVLREYSWLSRSGRLDGSISQGAREPVLLDVRAWSGQAGQARQAGRQAAVLICSGRPAAT